MKSARLLLLPVFLVFGACSGLQISGASPEAQKSPGGAPGQDQRRSGAEEKAIASALKEIAAAVKTDYKIGPTDLVEIAVYQNQDLSRKVRISQNGTATFPLIGTLQLGGLSILDAQNVLVEKLQEYIIDPQVTVFITEYAKKRIFVLGEVTKPGSFDLPAETRLTVLEAISLAGGFTQIAARDRTKIIRSTPGGASQTFIIEVSGITQGEKEKDLKLEPNDVIFVPQSYF